MYTIILGVIKTRNYELSDMLTKIDTLWVQGKLTEEQRLSLITEAQNYAMVENSVDLLNKVYELDMRVKTLEELVKKLTETGETPEEGGETEKPTYPEYEVGKWYYRNDIVSFDGQNYKCIAPERVVCTWSPSEYPIYWEVFVEDAPLTK